jgi:enoyl-CoA hydratase
VGQTIEHIRVDTADGVATITIDRPEKTGAMTYAMLGRFIEAIAEVGADDDARVVIVTGAPGTFCAGTDLSDLATIPGESRGLRGTAHDDDRWWPLVRCPKPVIGAIDGAAVGMGAEFTSQCDLRLATPRARFAWNFAHRGLVPDTGAGTWLLPRLVGHQTALRLLFTGEMWSADEALAAGYVLELVEPDDLLARANDLAQRILAVSPFSTTRIKKLVYEGATASVEEHLTRHTAALAECFKSDDHKEGVASFLERRPAHFTGR